MFSDRMPRRLKIRVEHLRMEYMYNTRGMPMRMFFRDLHQRDALLLFFLVRIEPANRRNTSATTSVLRKRKTSREATSTKFGFCALTAPDRL